MKWMEDYKSKCVTPDEAVSLIKSDNRIFTSGNAATPYVLLNALAKRRDELHQVDYTNDPFIVAKNDGIVAINSAIEVDFTGQICSDSIGLTIYSGFGGQVDFIRGAARAKGGKPIIALPSTTKNGQISRIVPHLKEGAGVVTSRGDVHYVVTEFGIAYLHGKSLRKRAEALIQIAHPDFHEELESFAKERRYL